MTPIAAGRLDDARFTPPAADEPVFDPSLVREEIAALAPCYGDPIWHFHVISQNPSATGDAMRWKRFPETLREQFRHVAWVLVNFPWTMSFRLGTDRRCARLWARPDCSPR
jgi:hypothetical protein